MKGLQEYLVLLSISETCKSKGIRALALGVTTDNTIIVDIAVEYCDAIRLRVRLYPGSAALRYDGPPGCLYAQNSMSTRILLLPIQRTVSLEAALASTSANPIVVTDCIVDGVETWEPQPWGWRTNLDGRTILNIDHHAEAERFFRPVSSGNLAIQYVGLQGRLPDGVPAVINHTDCDSILSAAILTGLLPPNDEFGAAVVAADHTGEPNAIADLLQALDPLRSIGLSLRNLNLLLTGVPLEASAVELLQKRDAERQRAAELVNSGAFQTFGSVAVAQLSAGDRISGEFLPTLLPGAAVIISASPMENGRWETKVRLGPGARIGETLFSLGVKHWEPNFAGRWNAGSTRRSGGSMTDPIFLARQINEGLAR